MWGRLPSAHPLLPSALGVAPFAATGPASPSTVPGNPPALSPKPNGLKRVRWAVSAASCRKKRRKLQKLYSWPSPPKLFGWPSPPKRSQQHWSSTPPRPLRPSPHHMPPKKGGADRGRGRRSLSRLGRSLAEVLTWASASYPPKRPGEEEGKRHFQRYAITARLPPCRTSRAL